MIKRTLFFSNPAYLSTKNEQLVVSFRESENKPDKTIPIEDLGYIILEHPQITITAGLIRKLVDNNTALITCNQQHMPTGFLQPLQGHSEQTERYRHQLNASVPLKKNLWQQTVMAKIENQAKHLKKIGVNPKRLERYAREVKTADHDNQEALAAAFYFQNLFDLPEFSRNQKGVAPNGLLNYGYAILRAVTARAIVGSGMLPSIGIFHKNKYNAFTLADDIMEPYRPFVDQIVWEMVERGENVEEVTPSLKAELLAIPALDVFIDGKNSPLMNAMSRTTNSLYECFYGSARKILYPVFHGNFLNL